MLILTALLAVLAVFFAWKYRELKKAAALGRSDPGLTQAEQIVRALGEPVLVVDQHGEVAMLNPVAEQLLELSAAEAVGQPYRAIYRRSSEGQVHQPADPIAQFLRRGSSPASYCKTRAKVLTQSGRELEVEEQITPLCAPEGKLTAVLVVFRPFSVFDIAEDRWEELTYRDPLTGLFNRAFFEKELARLDQPAHWPLSILFADLNGLKLANDIFGHSVGDSLIVEVASVLKQHRRLQDRVFRWGGDEFIVLLPNTGEEEARKMRAVLQEGFSKRAVGSLRLDVPMGLSTKAQPGQDVRIVVHQAAEEMYWLKTTGQRRYQEETMQRILHLLHCKSEGEKAHAERVQQLATEFGQYLGLSAPELRRLSSAAFLHDIGKVALDAELLHKPFPLEPNEQHEMNRHPLVGFRLLNFFEDTVDLAAAVLAHHEHWDGKGYPKGLKGEEIPLLGRIVAIVETYDRALYGPQAESYNQEQALQIIASGAGKKFDPVLARAFLRMMAEREEQERAKAKLTPGI